MNGVDRVTLKSRSGDAGRALTIGLVNNMPLAACSATERQFGQILVEAGTEQDVSLQCFRTGTGDAASRQACIDAIFEADLDGIIVTGAEPQSSNLREEPIWPLITRLSDWAEEQALSVMWSCLAAHAVILYLDGIDRVRLDRKVSGLFAGEIVETDHPLVEGLASVWTVPHSRHNDIPEQALVANGYRVLVRSPGGGVDLFQKVSNPAFVFLQSHPEYDTDSLRREFHRDVRRFLAGERHDAPGVPHSYFGSVPGTLPPLPDEWSSVRRENAQAILGWLNRCSDQPVRAPWRSTAVALYRNWLHGLAARKANREGDVSAFAGQAAHHPDRQQSGLAPC